MTYRHRPPRPVPDPVESRDFGCAMVLFFVFFVLVFMCGLLIGLVF